MLQNAAEGFGSRHIPWKIPKQSDESVFWDVRQPHIPQKVNLSYTSVEALKLATNAHTLWTWDSVRALRQTYNFTC